MNKIKHTVIAIVALLLSGATVFSREKADSLAVVSGQLSREVVKLAIEGASVTLYSDGDSIVRRTDAYGVFEFRKIKPGKVRIRAEKFGFDTKEIDIELSPGLNMVYLQLWQNSYTLDEAYIRASVDLVRRSGDTLKYNPKAMKTREDDYAIELLRQIPGARMRNGKLTIHGKKVERTYVNGIQIYGNDPLTAFNRIRADEVTQIEVYDQNDALSEYRGEKGKKERVVNIRTRESFLSAQHASLALDAGADEAPDASGRVKIRYNAGARAEFFSEMALARADAEIFNFGHPSAGYSHSGTSEPIDSDTRNFNVNLSFEKYWKDRTFGNSLSAIVFHQGSEEKRENTRIEDIFETESTIGSTTTGTNISRASNGKDAIWLTGRFMRTAIKSINTLHKIELSRSGSELNTSNVSVGRNTVSTNTANSSDDRNLAYTGFLRWQDNDNPKFSPYFDLTLKYDRVRGNSAVVDTSESSFSRQRIQSDINRNTMDSDANAGLRYTLSNSENSTSILDVAYSFKYLDDRREKLSLDLLDDAGGVIFAPGTYNYSWKEQDHAIVASYTYNTGDVQLFAQGAMNYKHQSDIAGVSAVAPLDYGKFSFCPSVNFSYRNRFELRFDSNSELPSMEQLRPVIDYSNALMLSGGNPGLSQVYHSNLSLKYNWLVEKSGDSFILEADLKPTFNPIVLSVSSIDEDTVLQDYGGYLAKAGSYLRTYRNADASLSSNIDAMWSRRLAGGLNLDAKISFGGNFRQEYSGASLVADVGFGPGSNIGLHYRNKKISANVTYRNLLSFNYLNGCSTNTRINNNINLNFFWNPHRIVSLRAEYAGSFSNYIRGTGNDVYLHTLGANLRFTLIRRKLFLGISAKDLLNRGNSYHDEINASGRLREWISSYGRYYILSLEWNFDKRN